MPDRVTAFAPGRVNLIGEHTDYNEGLALPFAISEGVTVRAEAIAGDRIEAVAADLRKHDEFELASPPQVRGWRAFVRGAVAELQRAGVPIRAARVEITGNVPRGGGLSSSAALEVALTLALIALAGAPEPDRIELAKICSRIENDWVGAQTGLLDQLASLLGEDDHALRIDFRSLEITPVPLELGEFKLITLHSGDQHSNAASGYNERRRECALASEELGVPSLRDATLEAATALPSPLDRRATHIVTENQRVDATVAALERRDMDELGRLLDASHASLRDCYEVSTPAVERAVEKLHEAGALGARIIGGGFGGHVLGLMPPDARVLDGAREVRPGPGALVWPADGRR
ncbi:MAG TPA: galactokinase [Solirubrobacteraceae bacterium]|nr:galactokinase [Solirubrobacteraceae bacterium]